MFGFFDRKERRRKKALESFREEMRKEPLADIAMRSALQMQIARRAGVLRASGNREKVAKEVSEHLDEDMVQWLSGKDAYDLHYLVETLRVCGLVKEAYSLLGKATHEWSKQFPIDPVWIHLDRGLLGHQIGDDVHAQIHCFNEAIACKPPAGSKCSWRDEARLQAAFWGFVSASANRLEGEMRRFLGFLQELSPEKDWGSSETLETFAKGHVGFLARDQFSTSKDGQERGDPERKEHTFHYCIFNRPRLPGESDTEDDRLARSLITAEVSVEKGDDGKPRFSCKLNKDHDYLDVLEANVAIFWYQCFEDGRVSREQVLNWLIDFNRMVGLKSLDRDPQYLSRDGEMVFYGALCNASMLAFTAFLDSVESRFEDIAKKFRIQLEEEGSRNRRAGRVPKAKRLRDLMIRGEIDREFSRLLCESVGMVTEEST